MDAGLSLLLSACGAPDDRQQDGAADDSPAEAKPAGMPVIRATLMLEMLDHGRNTAQVNYHKTVEICRAAGAPVKPLAKEQIAKLDTGRIELAVDADHRLVRETTWTWTSPLTPGSLCLFDFQEHVAESFVDARVTGWTGDESDPGWHEMPSQPDALQVYPIAADQDAEEDAVSRQLGWQLQGAGRELGQACKRWRDRQTEACVWSGGTAWGFSTQPNQYVGCFTADFGEFVTALPLRVEPLQGNGCRIRLQSMRVGTGALAPEELRPRTKT